VRHGFTVFFHCSPEKTQFVLIPLSLRSARLDVPQRWLTMRSDNLLKTFGRRRNFVVCRHASSGLREKRMQTASPGSSITLNA
jgi:hypothetical protein